MFKAGYVGVVGKPNAGKSSLINKIVGFKVSIVAPRPQTTRFNVKGIYTSDKSQIVFIDTPGINKPKNKLGEYMMDGVNNVVNSVSTLIYVVDSTKPTIDEYTENVIKNIIKLNKKTILCLNKIDKIDKTKLFSIIENYVNYFKERNFEFVAVVPISVFKNDGLDELIKVIEDNLDESEMLYDEDSVTDITEREIAEEIIREKLLHNYEDEIPHGVFVTIDSFKERYNVNNDLTYDITASIICLRNAHKAIIIGDKGSKIRHVTNLAKMDISKTLDVKVNLKIFVKVKEDWDNNDNYIKNVKFRNKC